MNAFNSTWVKHNSTRVLNNIGSCLLSSGVYKRYADTLITSYKFILFLLACTSLLLTYVYWQCTPATPIMPNTRVFETRSNNMLINQSLPVKNLSHGEQKNLIIGAAVNVHIQSLHRFGRSARAACHQCTIILFLTHQDVHSEDSKLLAQAFDIQLVTYEDLATLRKEKAFEHMDVHGRRWILFHDYLQKQETLGITFDNIFFSDVRDTVFQKNVFSYMDISGDGLYAFLEDVEVTIATQEVNARWIKTCYDERTLRLIGNNSVSCSGTVLGSWSAIKPYLSLMTSELLKKTADCLTIAGNDQGIHNYIIYKATLPGIKIHTIPHETGFVGTLAIPKWLKRNKFGLVLNLNKEAYAVVHQIDRSSQLSKQYDQQYPILPDDILNIK